jgi:hypothetical protein
MDVVLWTIFLAGEILDIHAIPVNFLFFLRNAILKTSVLLARYNLHTI